MNESISLQPTTCAICGTPDNAVQIYAANFNVGTFNPAIFSARRLPDRIHYRIVRCKTCGLLRSDPIAAPELLNRLYSQSDQTYQPEVANIQATYGRYLAALDEFPSGRESLLEIGCGSGFFLEEALAHGFRDVWGIEPSRAAVERSIPSLREKILCDVLRPGLFPEDRFDVICMFQVFDHLANPNESLDLCLGLLRPGGHLLALNHDAASMSARLLGESSPIIDIEHTYLYDRKTMAAIFVNGGFQVLRSGSASNHYSVQYLLQLTPLPKDVKTLMLKAVHRSGTGRLALTVALGNQFLIARKPAAGS